MRITKKIKSFWEKLGAGLITGTSDDDPSGIATYSQAGAAFGFSTLWTALITYPLMVAIQEMCARIGIATAQGLSTILATHYSKAISYFVLLLMYPALVINIAADLSGMSAVAALIFPIIPVNLFSTFFAASLLLGFLFSSYQKITSAMKYCCLVMFIYFLVPFFEEINWLEAARATLVPEIKWEKEYLMILVAILGTTISPYLFFWQASLCVEEQKHEMRLKAQKLEYMKVDVNSGMLFSNLIMFFIILATGAVLYPAGIRNIETVEQAAKALQPIAGEFAYHFFAIGVIVAGLLAVPVLAGCAGFLFAETFHWRRGLDHQPGEARKFYSVVSLTILFGWLITLFGVDPIKTLIFAAMLYGIIAPFIIALILLICNNKAIMKEHTNGWLSNVAGLLALLLMAGTAIAMFAV